MKTFLILFVLLNNFLFAQYYGERTTDQNFEESELYFKSHFLNPYGILNFEKAAPGLIDDPFLNLQINPSDIPNLNDDKTLIYLDYRSDRTEPSIVQNYILPNYYSNLVDRMYYNPTWMAVTRSEPQPIFSLGILTNPLNEITKKFFIGGTYQLLHKKEKFYNLPYFIYNPRYYYDAFNTKLAGAENIPISDRYAGKDEMMTDGHLFSAFTGYQLFENLKIGLSFNGIIHSRNGEYSNSYASEYGSTSYNDYNNSNSRARGEDYNHTDFDLGITYNATENFIVGINGGILNGKAEQTYNSKIGFLNQDNNNNTENKYHSFSNSLTEQNWQHKGTTKHIGFNFSRKINEEKVISGYYRYTTSDINISTNSSINDTSNYTSHYTYIDNNIKYIIDNLNFSSTKDLRTGSGLRDKISHEVLLNFKWNFSENNTLIAGVYFNSNKINTLVDEPVISSLHSEYFYNNTNGNSSHYINTLLEDKTLEWEYSSKNWTLQIPIIFQFIVSEKAKITLGINRILNSWKTYDRTTAYFKSRQRNQNGDIKKENNFGERYTQPSKNFTEDFLKAFFGFDFYLSKELGLRILIDPEFENQFRFAQWWLGFTSKL